LIVELLGPFWETLVSHGEDIRILFEDIWLLKIAFIYISVCRLRTRVMKVEVRWKKINHSPQKHTFFVVVKALESGACLQHRVLQSGNAVV
jgi:hypothetical protein